jgi:two-component system, LuxR family, response regulator FixJ
VANECGSVLVVDDDDGCRDLISDLLKRRGYSVREATEGAEALASARKEPPSLVLLEVHLPGMSGYDVCREFRAEFGEHLPILFISGKRTDPSDRVAGLRLGGDDYIVKPFDSDELLARVDRFVSRGRSNTSENGAIPFDLTKRELEVLQLLARGLSPKEIGQGLSVSRKTVSSHIQNVMIKLDVHSQAQAVAFAFRNGLVSDPTSDLSDSRPRSLMRYVGIERRSARA